MNPIESPVLSQGTFRLGCFQGGWEVKGRLALDCRSTRLPRKLGLPLSIMFVLRRIVAGHFPVIVRLVALSEAR